MARVNSLLVLTGIVIVLFGLSPAFAAVYTSTDVPKNIEDNQTVSSTITVTDAGTVADVNITLDITHTWDSDLGAKLISPAGMEILLFWGIGGTGQNFSGTTFDDEATVYIENGTAPFSGSYQPVYHLSWIDGESVAGTWTLQVTDVWDGDQGTLNSWSIDVTLAGAVGPTPTLTLDSPSPASLWPPNGKTKSVTISGSVVDAGGGVGSAWLALDDDYDVLDDSNIPLTLGANGSFSISLALIAGRLEEDINGRCYEITLHATNTGGEEATPVSVVVTVPHDCRK